MQCARPFSGKQQQVVGVGVAIGQNNTVNIENMQNRFNHFISTERTHWKYMKFYKIGQKHVFLGHRVVK